MRIRILAFAKVNVYVKRTGVISYRLCMYIFLQLVKLLVRQDAIHLVSLSPNTLVQVLL